MQPVEFRQAGWLRAVVGEMRALGVRELALDGISVKLDPPAPPAAELAQAEPPAEPAEDPDLVYASATPPRRSMGGRTGLAGGT